MVSCPICGFSENPGDSMYCTECGGKLAEESQPAPPQPEQQPQVEPSQPEQQPQAEPPQPEQQPQVEPPQPESQPTTGGVLKLPDNSDIQIGGSPKTIGRAELLDFLKTLQGVDPMVISRQHFTISQDKDKYFIEDGNTAVQDKPSANHTYLNGVDITDKGQQELKNDDVIDLADTIKLTFRS